MGEILRQVRPELVLMVRRSSFNVETLYNPPHAASHRIAFSLNVEL